MTKSFYISSKERFELIEITDKIEDIIKENKFQDGLCFVFTPHSTAGVILTENEAGLKKDWISFFKKIISDFDFEHDQIDNNADSHILSGLIGQGKGLIIENNQIIRGTWQQIFLAELDGPRKREIKIKLI